MEPSPRTAPTLKGPPCPECDSMQTVQTHDHFDQTTYFCLACERVWMLVQSRYVRMTKTRLM